jgi:hypothetical protein
MVVERELPAQVLVDAGVLEEGRRRLRRHPDRLIGGILLRPGARQESQQKSCGNPTTHAYRLLRIATAIRMVLA